MVTPSTATTPVGLLSSLTSLWQRRTSSLVGAQRAGGAMCTERRGSCPHTPVLPGQGGAGAVLCFPFALSVCAPGGGQILWLVGEWIETTRVWSDGHGFACRIRAVFGQPGEFPTVQADAKPDLFGLFFLLIPVVSSCSPWAVCVIYTPLPVSYGSNRWLQRQQLF